MRHLIFVFLLLFTAGVSAQELYLDPKAPVEARVEDLLQRMTLEEKIGQMTQLNLTVYNSSGRQADVDVVPEKFIPLVRDFHIGSFLNGAAVTPDVWVDYGRKIQELNLAHSRLKIPLIYGVDHVHGANYLVGGTIFPQPINLAATFDDSHAAAMGSVTASEVSDLGHHWIFAPILGLAVNPYWPRFYETFGEEPTVAGRMGVAYIRALQESEEAKPYRLAATAKHFLGYSASDSGWDRSPAQIPPQYLQEFFVPPFQAAVDAGVKTVMINSAEINGIPVHANRELLHDLLREQLGFSGVAVTDWEDILYLVSRHKVAHDEEEATLMALNAGVDMSMTALTTTFPGVVKKLVHSGKVSEERIDRSVRRILALKFSLGLFEHPYPRKDRLQRIGTREYTLQARRAAEQSLVLLKNNGVLPFQNQRIAVLGEAGYSKRMLSGGWTYNHQGVEEEKYPDDLLTIADALEREFGEPVSPEEADILVTVIGEEPYAEGSGNIVDLAFPEKQQRVVKEAFSYGKPVVLIVLEGRPRLISAWVEKAEAVLWAGLPGFEGGEAITAVLGGRVNPSGRLPFTYPSTGGHHLPLYHKANDKSTALYPFGFGLSYTRFSYSELECRDGVARVTVTNEGERDGREPVLWYLTDEVGRITRPVKRLVDYQSVSLKAGESRTLSRRFKRSDFAYPDKEGRSRVEEGWHKLQVGNLTCRVSSGGIP